MKISLQLYQVDYKSYLLDFKSLASNDEENDQSGSGSGSGNNSTSEPFNQSQSHHIMEFFEMCASLITQLAR